MKRFSTIAMLSTAVATAAVAAVFAMPLGASDRSATLLGVGLSAGSGIAALLLKRRALAQSGLRAALTAMVVMFIARAVLLGAGLAYVIKTGGNELAVVAGFFSVYFVQQTIELSWVVAASKSKESKEVPAT